MVELWSGQVHYFGPEIQTVDGKDMDHICEYAWVHLICGPLRLLRALLRALGMSSARLRLDPVSQPRSPELLRVNIRGCLHCRDGCGMCAPLDIMICWLGGSDGVGWQLEFVVLDLHHCYTRVKAWFSRSTTDRVSQSSMDYQN